MTYRVFISYASDDFKVAETVRDALEREGIRCWMAPRDLVGGQKWPVGIGQAIPQCEVLVIIFSRHANTSDYVANEVCLAVQHRCWLIPYRIDDVWPTGDLEFFLCRTHWFDAAPSGNGQALTRLCQVVRGVLATPRERHHPPRPLPKALKVAADVWGYTTGTASSSAATAGAGGVRP